MKEKEKGGMQCPQEVHHEGTAATETGIEPMCYHQCREPGLSPTGAAVV